MYNAETTCLEITLKPKKLTFLNGVKATFFVFHSIRT